MKILFSIIMTIFLFGCVERIPSYRLIEYETLCKEHGGIYSIVIGGGNYADCNDGTRVRSEK
jgi:hypothetical protein